MTRRDAGVILWAAAGTYALYSVGWLVAVEGRWLWAVRGSVLGEESLATDKAIFDLTVILLTLTGIALLRWRVALAAWLFRDLPRPAVPAGPAAPGETAAERIFALDLCALVVSAVALRLIVVCIGDLGAWASSSIWAMLNPSRWLRPGTARGLAPLLVLAAGALLLARRNRVAVWVLRGSPPVRLPAGGSDVQRIGLRLFGLMLIFGQLPNLATELATAYEQLRQGPMSHGMPSGLWQPLLPPTLSILLGAGLALGQDGLRSAWRRLRSQEYPRGTDGEDAEGAGTDGEDADRSQT